MRRTSKLIFAASFLSVILISGAAFTADSGVPVEFDAKVIFVYGDGTVMLYLGSEDGLVNGTAYQLASGQVKTATIKFTEVKKYCSKAQTVSSVSGLKEGEIYHFQLVTSVKTDEVSDQKYPPKMKDDIIRIKKIDTDEPSIKKIRVVRKNTKVHK